MNRIRTASTYLNTLTKHDLLADQLIYFSVYPHRLMKLLAFVEHESSL
jgi:hypothetical protein